MLLITLFYYFSNVKKKENKVLDIPTELLFKAETLNGRVRRNAAHTQHEEFITA